MTTASIRFINSNDEPIDVQVEPIAGLYRLKKGESIEIVSESATNTASFEVNEYGTTRILMMLHSDEYYVVLNGQRVHCWEYLSNVTSSEVDFREQVLKNVGQLPPERIEFPDFSQLEIRSIKKAVLFVYAGWSGPAILSFQILCQELSSCSSGDFPILVIDAVSHDPSKLAEVFGRVSDGWGDAFWIREGQLVADDAGYSKPGQGDRLKSRLAEFV